MNVTIIKLFLFSDPTAVGKTSSVGPSETKQATPNEKDEDSGSDYEENWSGEEWNDAQVRTFFSYLTDPDMDAASKYKDTLP